MEPTFFYVGLYFLISFLHISSCRIDHYAGWKNTPGIQYHIQTDEGDERFFKYQTKSGQYRKEKRLQDGSVVGAYGWVDADGYLRLREYIADNQGYRIIKTKMFYVGDNPVVGDSVPLAYRTKYGPLPRDTFPVPQPNQNRGYGRPIQGTYLPPYLRKSYQNFIGTPTTAPDNFSPIFELSPSFLNYRPHYSSTPTTVEVSYYSAPATATPEADVKVADYSVRGTSAPAYIASTPSTVVATYDDITPKPTAEYATTPKPIALDFVASTPGAVASYGTSPSPVQHKTSVPVIGIASSTTPGPPLPPVAGKFPYFDDSKNYVAEIEKNKLFFETKNEKYYDIRKYPDYKNQFQQYDGIATVQNGFRYYLPRHYHEEITSGNGQERVGSYGYIDPFGIRRVVYYNTAPGKGFVHRKNNRYVGFDSTPFDPRPNY